MIFVLIIIEILTLLTAVYFYEKYRVLKEGMGYDFWKPAILTKVVAIVRSKCQAKETKLGWIVRVTSGSHKGIIGRVDIIMEERSIFITEMDHRLLIRVNSEEQIERLNFTFSSAESTFIKTKLLAQRNFSLSFIKTIFIKYKIIAKVKLFGTV